MIIGVHMKGIEKNKRVLVVKLSPYNALTSSNMRVMAIMKGLQDIGYDIDWLTISPSIVHTLRDVSCYEFMKKVNYIIANKNTIYDNLVNSQSNFKKAIIGFLRKIYHFFKIYDYTESIAKHIDISILSQQKYDYIFSVSDPKTSHIAVRRLIEQGLKYKRWIQYWGDPLVGDITNKHFYPRFVLKKEERKLFSVSDKIVYTSPFTLQEAKKNHSKHKEKMIVLPTPYMEIKCYGFTNNNRPLISYFGAYNSNVRNVEQLYCSAKSLTDFDFIIVGDSDLTLEPTDNVIIKPRGDIAEDEKKTDIYVCVLNNSGTQIPGKVYHDAATDKAVLVILDGERGDEIKEYLSSFNRYYFCKNKAEDITKALRQIVKDKKEWSPAKELEPSVVVKKMLSFED